MIEAEARRRNAFLERISLWLATGLGVGYLRPAPGTMGSLLGLALFLFFLAPRSVVAQLLAWAALTIAGTLAATVAARRLGDDDPSAVVVDEIAGMWLAAIATTGAGQWLLAFFLFRLFDIVKPFPARRLESWSGGVGIMADDVVAALYARVAVAVWALWG